MYPHSQSSSKAHHLYIEPGWKESRIVNKDALPINIGNLEDLSEMIEEMGKYDTQMSEATPRTFGYRALEKTH